jgi:hypothetical protein
VFFMPALTAITRAMLSLVVRPLTVGTVIGGSFAAAPVVVLDAVREDVAAGTDAGTVELAPSAVAMVDELTVATLSPFGEGRASLLAAQAMMAMNGPVSSEKDAYL